MSFALLQAAPLGGAIALVILAVFLISIAVSAIKIVNEYERGVIFRLGRIQGGPKGPGLFILLPFIDKMIKVDLRTVTMDVPPQDIITRDNVPAEVNAVIYFRVVDPNNSVVEVENYVQATSQISQTTLRSVPRPAGPRRTTHQPRGNKYRASEHHRRADRPLGHQGQRRGGQGRGDPAADAASDGTSGRERARAAGQDHLGRG